MPITWHKSIGHNQVKEVLSRAYDKKELGHAYLFTGVAGVGKFPLALEFAQGLLCESESRPCGECTSCRQVLTHSHPDFRLLFPIAFEKQHKVTGKSSKLSEEGWDYLGEKIKEKIAHPYKITTNYTVSPMVDWIRELTSAINRGSSRSSSPTVVIIEGIEEFRKESANALLKTLEEPPPNTVIILLSRSLNGVLPTIRSRCQLFRFGELPQNEILPFLHEHHSGATEEELQLAVHECFGSPGMALDKLTEDGSPVEQLLGSYLKIVENRESALEQALALELFVEGSDEDCLSGDFGLSEALLEALVFLIRASFLKVLDPQAEYIFTLREGAVFERCSARQIDAVITILEQALTSTRLHTPLLSVFTMTTLNLVEILNE